MLSSTSMATPSLSWTTSTAVLAQATESSSADPSHEYRYTTSRFVGGHSLRDDQRAMASGSSVTRWTRGVHQLAGQDQAVLSMGSASPTVRFDPAHRPGSLWVESPASISPACACKTQWRTVFISMPAAARGLTTIQP